MELKILYLGRKDYNECLKLQEELFKKRQENRIKDVLILVEHNPVLTLGRSANRDNIIASEEILKNENIEIVKIGRGGDVTYHGPGQLVGYPIMNIRDKNLGVKDFVYNIEQVIIDTCKSYGIDSYRDDINNGCWVNNKKIAAVGFKVKKWVTMHGFAFNINTNLDHFKYIIPCGITDREATSLNIEVGKEFLINDVQKDLINNFCRIFDYSDIEEVREGEFI